jgi:hypothetical protein
LENQRTDVASVVSVQLMTIFFEKTYRICGERVFPIQIHFQNNNLGQVVDSANPMVS